MPTSCVWRLLAGAAGEAIESFMVFPEIGKCVRLRSGLSQLFFARRVLHGTSIPRWRGADGVVRYGGQLPPEIPPEIPLAFAWGTCKSKSVSSRTRSKTR